MAVAALVVVGVVCDPCAVPSLRTEMLRVRMLQSPNALTLPMQGTQDPSGWREGKLQSGQWLHIESQGGGREWEVGVNWLAGEGSASQEGLSCSVAPGPTSPVTTQTSIWGQAQLAVDLLELFAGF